MKLSFDTVDTLLNAIKDMWIAGNYFTQVTIDKGEEYDYEIKFYHSMNKNFSEFWANYFKSWLERNMGVKVDFILRNEAFYLKIKIS